MFKANRDQLHDITFKKLKIDPLKMYPCLTEQSFNQVDDNSFLSNSENVKETLFFIRMLKKELLTSKEDLQNTGVFATKLDSIQDERLLKEMIELVYLFGKKHPLWLSEHPQHTLKSIFDKNLLKLRKSVSLNITNLQQETLLHLLKLQYSSVYLTQKQSFSVNLDIIHLLLDNYTLELWTFKSVRVIKSCLNLLYFSLKSAFLRTLDISLNHRNEDAINTYLKIRPEVLKRLSYFTLYSQSKNKLTCVEVVEIRKEAFELLIKMYSLISHDAFCEYKLIYTLPSRKGVETIIGFLVECAEISRSRLLEVEGVIVEKELLRERTVLKRLIDVSEKVVITEYKKLVLSILEQDGILPKVLSSTNVFNREKDRDSSINSDPSNNNTKDTENLRQFWDSHSGADTKYYLFLLVCDLMDRCSKAFYLDLAPSLIFSLTHDNFIYKELSAVLYSFLRSVLRKDMRDRTKAFFWKIYLQTIQLEGQNYEKILSITRMFVTVYHSQVKEIRRSRSKHISEKLQVSSEAKEEEFLQHKIVFANYLNFLVYLIQQIEPEAKDYRRVLSSLLVGVLLRPGFFEVKRLYSEVLEMFLDCVEKIEGVHFEIKKQKRMVTDFVVKQLNVSEYDIWDKKLSIGSCGVGNSGNKEEYSGTNKMLLFRKAEQNKGLKLKVKVDDLDYKKGGVKLESSSKDVKDVLADNDFDLIDHQETRNYLKKKKKIRKKEKSAFLNNQKKLEAKNKKKRKLIK